MLAIEWADVRHAGQLWADIYQAGSALAGPSLLWGTASDSPYSFTAANSSTQ